MYRHRAAYFCTIILAFSATVPAHAKRDYQAAANASSSLGDIALLQSMAAMSSSSNSSDQKSKDLAAMMAMMQMMQANKAKQAESKNREADKKTESTETVKAPTIEYPKPYESPLKNVVLTTKDVDVSQNFASKPTPAPAAQPSSSSSTSVASTPSGQSDRPANAGEEMAELTRGPVNRPASDTKSGALTTTTTAGVRPGVVAGRPEGRGTMLQPIAGQLPTAAPVLPSTTGLSPDLGKQVLSNLQNSKTMDDEPRLPSRPSEAREAAPHEGTARAASGYGESSGGGGGGGRGSSRLDALLAATSLSEAGLLPADDTIRIPTPRLKKKKGGVRHPDDPDPDWNIFEYAGFRMERLKNKHKRIVAAKKRDLASEPPPTVVKK